MWFRLPRSRCEGGVGWDGRVEVKGHDEGEEREEAGVVRKVNGATKRCLECCHQIIPSERKRKYHTSTNNDHRPESGWGWVKPGEGVRCDLGECVGMFKGDVSCSCTSLATHTQGSCPAHPPSVDKGPEVRCSCYLPLSHSSFTVFIKPHSTGLLWTQSYFRSLLNWSCPALDSEMWLLPSYLLYFFNFFLLVKEVEDPSESLQQE